jgi:hypothetical protein
MTDRRRGKQKERHEKLWTENVISVDIAGNGERTKVQFILVTLTHYSWHPFSEYLKIQFGIRKENEDNIVMHLLKALLGSSPVGMF